MSSALGNDNSTYKLSDPVIKGLFLVNGLRFAMILHSRNCTECQEEHNWFFLFHRSLEDRFVRLLSMKAFEQTLLFKMPSGQDAVLHPYSRKSGGDALILQTATLLLETHNAGCLHFFEALSRQIRFKAILHACLKDRRRRIFVQHRISLLCILRRRGMIEPYISARIMKWAGYW